MTTLELLQTVYEMLDDGASAMEVRKFLQDCGADTMTLTEKLGQTYVVVSTLALDPENLKALVV